MWRANIINFINVQFNHFKIRIYVQGPETILAFCKSKTKHLPLSLLKSRNLPGPSNGCHPQILEHKLPTWSLLRLKIDINRAKTKLTIPKLKILSDFLVEILRQRISKSKACNKSPLVINAIFEWLYI